ncbi:hypothetical protein L9F63_022132 [Diploptera punctata]|uniref:DUF4771 domain-containing protein n=1 Tax=Diploptera punctata TaxID=6984 RepID=A0AAD8EB90_DIPPU|nr:hypothetical protein L9F63_022132 [Diploptera punctata]
MRKKTYSSPYEEPLPFLKHCYEEENKLEIQLRDEYLNKCKLQKAFEEEEEKKIELQLITGGRSTQPMVHSKKPDGNDQIKIMMENQVPSRKSLRPDKKYPIPSLETACGAICTGKDVNKCVNLDHIFQTKQSLQLSNLDTISQIEEQKYKNKIQDPGLKKEHLEKKISQESDEMLIKKIQELMTGMNESDEVIDTYSSDIFNKDKNDEEDEGNDEISKDEDVNVEGDYRERDYEDSGDISPLNQLLENINGPITKKSYPKPVFLSLEDQFPRPNWGYKDYTNKPIFSCTVCGHNASAETEGSEHESVNRTDSEAFLYKKSMQLPNPIPTVPTIKATITGYWQHYLYTFKAPKLTPQDVKTLKKGGEAIFTILAKNALNDMAQQGNPIACLPHVEFLPEIKQLIRSRVNFKLSENFKDKLMLKSVDLWEKTIGSPKRVEMIDLEMKGKRWTWDRIYNLKKMVHKHAFEYRGRVRQALLDDVRSFWASMFMEYFNNPGFKSVFFAYLPSKQDDILYPIP